MSALDDEAMAAMTPVIAALSGLGAADLLERAWQEAER
jgi:hypothetical protein